MQANPSTTSTPQAPPLLFDVHEAGRRLGVHPETVARLCRRGEIGCVKIGRAIRLSAAHLEAFIAERTTGGVPTA